MIIKLSFDRPSLLLFLYSLKVGQDDLIIRKRIREIANREDNNIVNSDSVVIKKIQNVLAGHYPIDSLKTQKFHYNDLKTAIRGLWNSDGTTYYMHKIIPKNHNTILTFIGYFPEQDKRKYITISMDANNTCILIDLK